MGWGPAGPRGRPGARPSWATHCGAAERDCVSNSVQQSWHCHFSCQHLRQQLRTMLKCDAHHN
ncbi:hypothetical protein YT1_3366 [Rhodococcus ruber]|nr:hypothetical protein YT1_3366 [Rhodococcus ruber]